MAVGKEIDIRVNLRALEELRSTTEKFQSNVSNSNRQIAGASQQSQQELQREVELLKERNRLRGESQVDSRYTTTPSGIIVPKTAVPPQQQQQPTPTPAAAPETADKGLENTNKILRDILDAIKLTSRNEIRNENINQAASQQQRRREQQDGDGWFTNWLAGLFGDVDDEFEDVGAAGRGAGPGGAGGTGADGQGAGGGGRRRPWWRRDTRLTRNLRRGGRIAGHIAKSQNEYYALSNIFGDIPFVGDAISTYLQRGIGGAERLETAGREFAQLRGMTTSSAVGLGGLLNAGAGPTQFLASQYGMTPSQMLSQISQFQRGFKGDILPYAENLIAAQRVLPIDQQTMQGVLEVGRYEAGRDPTAIFGIFERHLRDMNKNMSEIPELANTFTTVANQILQVSGTADTQSLAKIISSISAQTGFEGKRLSRFVGGISNLRHRAGQAPDPFMLQAYRETYGGDTYQQLLARMETPFATQLDIKGIESGGIEGLRRYFQLIMANTTGDEAVGRLVSGIPGISVQDAMKALEAGDPSVIIQSAIDAAKEGVDQEKIGEAFRGNALEKLGRMEESSAKVASWFESHGTEMITTIDEIFRIIEVMGTAEFWVDPKKTLTDAIQDAILNTQRTNTNPNIPNFPG